MCFGGRWTVAFVSLCSVENKLVPRSGVARGAWHVCRIGYTTFSCTQKRKVLVGFKDVNVVLDT